MPDTTSTPSITNQLADRLKNGNRVVTGLILAGIAGVGLYFWGQLVPWLIDVASNTLELAGLCAALFAVGILLFEPHARLLWIYGYRSMCRAITGAFIEIDPIGILKTYVSRLRSRLAEIMEAIGSLQGQRDQLAEYIQKNENERLRMLERAKTAKRLIQEGGKDAERFRGQLAISGRQAGRMESSNRTTAALLAKMDKMLTVLKKLHETSALAVEDMDNEVKYQTEQYKAITKAAKALKSVQGIMGAGGAERELFDQTMDRMQEVFNEKMGQIDYFMECSKSMVDGADLDNAAFEDSALALLNKWEQEGVDTDAMHARVEASAGKRVATADASPDSSSFESMFDNNNTSQQQGRQ